MNDEMKSVCILLAMMATVALGSALCIHVHGYWQHAIHDSSVKAGFIQVPVPGDPTKTYWTRPVGPPPSSPESR